MGMDDPVLRLKAAKFKSSEKLLLNIFNGQVDIEPSWFSADQPARSNKQKLFMKKLNNGLGIRILLLTESNPQLEQLNHLEYQVVSDQLNITCDRN